MYEFISGSIFTVLVGLIGFYAKRRIGQREECQRLVHRVLAEIGYNSGSGVGDVRVPFRLDAHKELSASSYPSVSEKIRQLAQESCRVGALCNGGKTSGSNNVVPNTIKYDLGPPLRKELQQLLKGKKRESASD